MRIVSGLKALVAVLGVTAVVSCAQFVWGDPSGSSDRVPLTERAGQPRLGSGIDSGRFSLEKSFTYQTSKGDSLFALQVKPDLEAGDPRPRDIVVMIDTTASQAGRPFELARQITEEVMRSASPSDKIAVWTLNTPKATHSLTQGLRNADAGVLADALQELRSAEYASGASDLKNGFEKALDESFEGRLSRQQIILFLGDGESAYNNLSEKDRLELAQTMRNRRTQFFAVPLGPKIHAQNVNSLVVGTGGVVVRLPQNLEGDKAIAHTVDRFNEAARVPVLMPTELKFGTEVVEHFPSKLPPLRADTPTLIVGKLAKPSSRLDLSITGKVVNTEKTLDIAEELPESRADHYFLSNIVDQWRSSGHPEAPALLRADRTLALAYEQCRLARDELLAQAHWAVHEDQYEVAANLYSAVNQLDPSEKEAAYGLKVAKRLSAGELTKEALEKNSRSNGDRLMIKPGRDEQVNAVRVRLQELADEEPAGGAAPVAAAILACCGECRNRNAPGP